VAWCGVATCSSTRYRTLRDVGRYRPTHCSVLDVMSCRASKRCFIVVELGGEGRDGVGLIE
jgi:hypothetical protein